MRVKDIMLISLLLNTKNYCLNIFILLVLSSKCQVKLVNFKYQNNLIIYNFSTKTKVTIGINLYCKSTLDFIFLKNIYHESILTNLKYICSEAQQTYFHF